MQHHKSSQNATFIDYTPQTNSVTLRFKPRMAATLLQLHREIVHANDTHAHEHDLTARGASSVQPAVLDSVSRQPAAAQEQRSRAGVPAHVVQSAPPQLAGLITRLDAAAQFAASALPSAAPDATFAAELLVVASERAVDRRDFATAAQCVDRYFAYSPSRNQVRTTAPLGLHRVLRVREVERERERPRESVCQNPCRASSL